MTIDEAGLIYIKHQGHGKHVMDTIVVFDPPGKFVRSFGKDIYPGGHGIDIRKEAGEEFLYLCDIDHRQVIKTNLKGEVVWKLDYPKEAGVYKDATGYKPTNVAFAPDGGFYVGDGYGSHYIHQYDKDANWVRTWGGQGTEPGKMNTPHGLWLDDRPGRTPSLVVADRANARLQYFTLDGKHISFVNDVLFPAHFDIRGDVLLVPDLHARVSLFDRDNKAIVASGRRRDMDRGSEEDADSHGPQTLGGGQIRPSARCLLRPRRQYLRRRMGRYGAGHIAEESELSYARPPATGGRLQATGYGPQEIG